MPEQPAGSNPAPRVEMRGLVAGAIVLAGVVAVNGGNYAANLIAARYLGPGAYGDLVALLTLSALIGLPLGALQIFTSRYAARFATKDDDDAIRLLARRGLRLTLAAGAVLVLILEASTPVLRSGLGIGTTIGVVLTNLLVLPNVATPVVWGIAQGLQRFRLLSTSMVAGSVVRLLVLVPLLLGGAGVAGALGAALIGGVVSLGLPIVVLRGSFAAPTRNPTGIPGREVATYLVPVAIGILAITSLSTIDVLVAKASFSGVQAGVYGSASLVGRLVLYVPTAIVTVLLPKVTSYAEAGRTTLRLLTTSLGVTLAIGLVAIASYSTLAGTIVSVAFGHKYATAAPLLWMFAVAMTAYAIMNVFLYYHLGRGDTRVSWFLLGGAAVQLLVYLFFHSTPRELLAASICVGWTLVALEVIALAVNSRGSRVVAPTEGAR